MRTIKTIIRNSILYIASAMVVASAPLSAYAVQPPVESEIQQQTRPSDQQSSLPTSIQSEQVPESDVPQQAADSAQPTETVSPSSTAQGEESEAAQQDATTDATGSDSAATDTDTSTATDSTTNTTIDNTQSTTAQSGNAQVTQNTTAGDATTGNATVQTTVVNTVHSTIGGDMNGVAYFTTDINGNVYGDITISPSINAATQAMNANMSSAANLNNTTGIANTIDGSATTGNATVSENTTAGNATTGNANAVANVINLINTIISANKSFVGTINIYGDLNGDILVSPEFIPQLLASNQTATTIGSTFAADLNNDQQIINTIKLNAASGSATVSDNTNAGSATTGTAQTNLTILNLTGHSVTAKNSLLVFVNVLGKWVGLIVDAPSGTTAAAFGSGVSSLTSTASAAVNISDKSSIINDITLHAQSGDALVDKNTNAGNATSGNATASANIANINASTFNVSDWFGVLFINVFGTWLGSFGVNTANGDAIAQESVGSPASASPAFRFGFTPTEMTRQASTSPLSSFAQPAAVPSDDDNDASPKVLLASTSSPVQSESTLTPQKGPREDPFGAIFMASSFGIAIVGAGVLVYRRFF